MTEAEGAEGSVILLWSLAEQGDMATAASLRLTTAQLNWALKIVAIVKGMKLSSDIGERACDIALGTALTESGLRMYANGNNPASMRIAHDAVGWDHGSVGLFQQQVGGAANSTANWGTTAQCMDVGYSTRKFLSALFSKNWTKMTNWDAAQAVQGSYDPTGGNYKKNDSWAIQIRKALWGSTSGSTSTPTPTPGPVAKPASGSTYTVRSGDTMSTIASSHHMTLAALENLNPRAGHPAGHFDSIQPGDKLRVSGAAPAPASTSVTYRVRQGDTLVAIAHRYRVTWQSIAKLNHLSDPNKIYPGQVLKIG